MEPCDFLAKVEFFGTPSTGFMPEDRVRVVQDILKTWTVRACRRGRPPRDEGNLEDAA
jgi:hypothetical protein